MSNNLNRCPLYSGLIFIDTVCPYDVMVLVSECSHEHFCPNAAETCIKSAACSDNVTGRLEKTGENRNRTIFVAPRRLYFHGFEGPVDESGHNLFGTIYVKPIVHFQP